MKPSGTKMKHIPSSWPSRSISIDKLDLKRIFSEKKHDCVSVAGPLILSHTSVQSGKTLAAG